MFKLRGCPKCHGDLYVGEDIYGTYLSCVQCGRYFAVADAPAGASGRFPTHNPPGRRWWLSTTSPPNLAGSALVNF